MKILLILLTLLILANSLVLFYSIFKQLFKQPAIVSITNGLVLESF